MNFETLKRSHLKRNIIIEVIVVAIISAIVLNFTRAKYRITQSIPIVNGTINYSLADLNIVAITVDGEASDTIPDGNYDLMDTSYCTVNGEKDTNITLSYDSATKNLTITPFTTKGTKCYLNFKKEKVPVSDIVTSLVSTSNEVVEDDFGNARYIGANPNNYVYFNCDDYNNPSSSTCELWRIIGVFNEDTHEISSTKLVKLIRNDSIGNFVWSTNEVNDWATASLQESLNESYLSGTDLGSGKGITATTQNMLENVTWKLGGISEEYIVTKEFYERERGTAVYSGRSTIWIGKIALMYPSDYGYATSGGGTVNRASCLAKELRNWGDSGYSDCKNNDWLYDSSTHQWALSPSSNGRAAVSHIYPEGLVYHFGSVSVNNHNVRPCIYLKYNIVISGGKGTITEPYTIS